MKSKYTAEQHDWFKANVLGRSYLEIQAGYRAVFGMDLSLGQIKGYLAYHKLTTGRTGRFAPGHTPANKGKKGMYTPGSEKGWFTKGGVPPNWRPVGSERIDNKDGYTLIKVAEPNVWKLKHKVIFENAYGPIPRGHVVIFADGNKQNITLDNLILISRAQLARLNQNNLIACNKELTQTGILVADIISKAAKRRRGDVKKPEVTL